jgi:hypothetical protein
MVGIPKLPRSVRLRQWLFEQADGLTFLPKYPRYALTIGRKPAFVWFQIAKVATHSILEHFESHGVEFDVRQGYDLHFSPRLHRHDFKFAFVRNPWDRLVSCWRNKIVDKRKAHMFKGDPDQLASFDRFVNHLATQDLARCDIHIRLQCVQIDLNHLDFLGRLEHLDRDFNHVCQTLGLPGDLKAKTNASSRESDYRIYYTDPLAEKVGALYRRDIEMFGYTFDPPARPH